jgi:hypothetical protein
MADPRPQLRLVVAAIILASALCGTRWSGQVAASDATSAADADACPVTPYAAEVLDPSFSATWYRSGDLWAAPDGSAVGTWFADPEWMKVQWRRPIGVELTVEGRRLDGAAPPLSAEESDGYEILEYTFTPMTFPTEGCWEVIGRIPGAELRFVVLVHPGEQHYRHTPPATPEPDLWQTLLRPLEPFDLEPDASCPVTPTGDISRVEGVVYGDGPVYLQAIDDAGRLVLSDDGTLSLRWIVSPEAPGAFLVRGVPRDGAQVRFGAANSQPGMRFLTRLSSDTSDWEIWPTPLTVPGLGCYTLQIDAPTFTQVITLEIAF